MFVGKNGETSISLDILQKKGNFFLQNKPMKQPSRELTFALVEIRIAYLFLFQVILSFPFLCMPLVKLQFHSDTTI